MSDNAITTTKQQLICLFIFPSEKQLNRFRFFMCIFYHRNNRLSIVFSKKAKNIEPDKLIEIYKSFRNKARKHHKKKQYTRLIEQMLAKIEVFGNNICCRLEILRKTSSMSYQKKRRAYRNFLKELHI